MRPLLLLPLLLAALTMPANATVHLADPWPDPAVIQGIQVEPVTFPSSSPFTPGAVMRRNLPPTTAIATLYLPPGTAADHATPAVVLLHGAAGRVAERGAIYGQQL